VLASVLGPACAAAQGGRADAPAVAAEDLPPDQARGLMMAAHRGRNPVIARALAEVLLQRDPRDVQALQVLAASYYASGRPDLAVAAGRRAWAASGTSRQLRFDSAMIVAESQFSRKRIGASRFWLRRAAEYAPTAAGRDTAIRAFRGIAPQQRLRTRLDFGIAPNSNVNGGSSSDTLVLFGIPFTLSGDSQALSGIEYRSGLGLTYRLSEDRRHATDIGANLALREYSLTSEAEAQAPGAKGSDYAFAAAEVFVRYAFLPGQSTNPADVRLTLGHNWYGREDLSDYLRLDIGREWKTGERTAFRLGAGVERQERYDRDDRSATIATLSGEFRGSLATGNGYAFGLSLRDVDARAVDTEHDAAILSVSYGWTRPVLGAEVTASLSVERRDYPRSAFAAGGREDTRMTAGLSLFFREMDYLGFAPQIDLRASRNASNVSLYDSLDLGISLGLRSSF
jgi:hypothetical protein